MIGHFENLSMMEEWQKALTTNYSLPSTLPSNVIETQESKADALEMAQKMTVKTIYVAELSRWELLYITKHSFRWVLH